MEENLQKKADRYDAGFHNKPLLVAWIGLANLAFIFASLRWWKYSFYFHALFGVATITLTLFSTVHVLVDDWLSPDEKVPYQMIHNIGGLVAVIWLGVEIITGILSRIIQYLPGVSSRTNYWIKKTHNVSSYLIMYGSKFLFLQIYYFHQKYDKFALYLALELFCLIVFIWIKTSYWTLSQQIVDSQLISIPVNKQNKFIYILQNIKYKLLNLKQQINQKCFKIPKITYSVPLLKSQQQITIKNYVLFNDYVYNLDNMGGRHPGGLSVINEVKHREINRFMYGFFGLESGQAATMHQHSNQSMRLCGKPIGKIQRSSPMKGFQPLNKYQIFSSQNCLKKSSIYLIYLKAIDEQNHQRLIFEGYQNQSQFGQYFSFTVANKNGKKRCTRLYTTVWCLRPQNLQFMQKNFPSSTRFAFEEQEREQIVSVTSVESNLEQALIKDIDKTYIISRCNEQIIPFVIKKYKDGKLGGRLFKQNFDGEIILSEPMGAGLKFHQVRETGKVLIVCGGTGILPFADFIDVLFKRIKVLENSPLSEYILNRDSLAGKDLIKNREFVIFFASQTIFDCLPTLFYQINYLSRSNLIKFSAYMKIKDHQKVIKQRFSDINYQQQSFNEQIQNLLKEDLAKIYVCGPPVMNANLSSIFNKYKVSRSLYQFI